MSNSKEKELPATVEEEQKSIITYFKDEETELNNTIQEIDELYAEVKEHYDQLKIASRSANGGRGILTFLQNQTANLVSLKNSKASLINSKISMKKHEAELALKHRKEENESSVNNELINAIMDRLEEQDENSTIVIEDPKNNESYDEDELLEMRVQELINNGDIQEDDPIDIEEEGILAILIKDKKWKFVGINENGKIIKGFPVPNKKDYTIHLEKDDNGKTIAIDQDDKIYRVIRRKSKKVEKG